MDAEQFLEKFDTFADVPGAAGKLRGLVLDLAIRGSLTDQRHDDEPAWELLRRAREKAAHSPRAGRLKRLLKQWKETRDGDPPALPTGWAWSCSAAVGECGPRNDLDDETEVGFAPMGLLPTDYRSFFLPEVKSWREVKKAYTHLADGDVAFAKITPCFQNGKGAVFRDLPGGFGAGTTELHVLRPFDGVILPQYAMLFYKSPSFVRGGVDSFSGTAGQQRVSADYFRFCPLPLPPLAEQARIVAAVDRLTGLCDRLEAEHAERDARRAALARAATARFAADPAPASLEYILHASFDVDPADLRRSILSMAAQGNLVRQENSDVPLSKAISHGVELPDGHKRRRKILKPREIAPAEFFAEIPETWTYATIQELYEANLVVDYADGNHGSLYPRKSEFGDDGVNFVSAKDIADGRVNWEGCSHLNEERAAGLVKGWSKGGDVLLTHNATVGRVARVERKTSPFLLGTSVTFYRMNEQYLDRDFIYHIFCSPVWQDQLRLVMEQTTRNQVSIQKQACFKIPVPPLAEQRRIVAKADELLALIDRLEAQQTAARDLAARTLNAAVAALTA